MWQRLKARGVTDDQLARVRAPIGLPIGGDSPGEIAVSIVAELVQARRRAGK
jgi:xanthine dehydrogenase accessory factor